jgi:GNAT superfamily N-acetyltransferase
VKRPNAPRRRYADPRPPVNPIVETEAFKRWFGASQVVDRYGQPLVVYHGTPDARGLFLPEVSTSGQPGFHTRFRGEAFFATDSVRVANTYADHHRAFDYQAAEPLVVPLYLRIENPLLLEGGGRRWRGTERFVEEARNAGHDGIIIRNSLDDYHTTPASKPSTVYVFFSPTQAKSAQVGVPVSRVDRKSLPWAGPNDGSFDLDDSNLRSNPPCTLHKANKQSRFGFMYERDVFDFFMEHGIHISDYEEPFEVCVDEHGHMIGASTFGCRHEEDEGCLEYSFSVAVDPDARRSGVARRLVKSIIDQHPGIYLSPWVVNPHMALLLESMGFEADGEWSQDTPYMSLWTPAARANGARPNMRRLKGYRDYQGQDDRYYLQQYKLARHLAAKLQRVVKDDVRVEIYPKKPIGGSFVMLVVGNGRGAELNMQLVRREATDERDDSRRWRDWTLTPRGPKDRGLRGDFAQISEAMVGALREAGLLRPRSNISFDEWTAREARRTLDQEPPALSRGQALPRRPVAKGPDLFSGPLIERPEIKFARQQVAKGEWPYGSLDGIIARVVGAAVEALDGNVRAASRALEISHTTTMRWLRTYRDLIEAGKLPEP